MRLSYSLGSLLTIEQILSCSKKDKVEVILEEQTIEEEMILAYREGLESLEKGDALHASKKFNEVIEKLINIPINVSCNFFRFLNLRIVLAI